MVQLQLAAMICVGKYEAGDTPHVRSNTLYAAAHRNEMGTLPLRWRMAVKSPKEHGRSYTSTVVHKRGVDSATVRQWWQTSDARIACAIDLRTILATVSW